MTLHEKPQTTIGSKELVDFPELDLANVPAKIDTGADSSSIWATDVHVTPEGLKFTPFGIGSKLFAGKPIVQHDYRTTLVKNSFGVSEERYKAKLVVRVSGRRIRGWFTLSDRSTMTYPVLLGRRLLKNKFLVDVGKMDIPDQTQDKGGVLILSKPLAGLADFVASIKAKSQHVHDITTATYDDLLFHVEVGNTSITLPDGTDLASFAIVYFKNHEDVYALAIAAARYRSFHLGRYIDKELTAGVSYDKLSEAMMLATHGVPVAPLFCGSSTRLLHSLDSIVKALGLPLVCKDIHGTRGHNNFLATTKEEVTRILTDATAGRYYLIQKYIENDGYIRALVLGHAVALAIQRTPVVHADLRKTHLNNPRGSQNASLIPASRLPAEVSSMTVRSADIMKRQIAGVDIIQDKTTKAWYILEVNHAPELIGGAFPEEKHRAIAAFFDEELRR